MSRCAVQALQRRQKVLRNFQLSLIVRSLEGGQYRTIKTAVGLRDRSHRGSVHLSAGGRSSFHLGNRMIHDFPPTIPAPLDPEPLAINTVQTEYNWLQAWDAGRASLATCCWTRLRPWCSRKAWRVLSLMRSRQRLEWAKAGCCIAPYQGGLVQRLCDRSRRSGPSAPRRLIVLRLMSWPPSPRVTQLAASPQFFSRWLPTT